LLEVNKKQRQKADNLYLTLAGLFITALVVCNLIANKFVSVDLGFYTFTLSAGVLPYPITFLITDILSEMYGRKKTSRVVLMGFAALLFTILILWLGKQFAAIESSPVSDSVYNAAFGNSQRVIFASMTAYLVAQLVDVRSFHFWKRLTNGKMLWLRNNASTMLSQLVDTTLVVGVLFYGKESFETMSGFIIDGWLFKALAAFVDTIPIYIIVWIIRRQFNLKWGQEIS
jgi:uncharacterized integral membrane protein (TIGR00697 family)